MEKFRRRVITRTIIMSLIVILVGLLYMLFTLNQDKLPKLPDFIEGFQMGAFLGLELILIFMSVNSARALKTDEKLRRLYVKENDERKNMIRQKTGGIGLFVCEITIGIATIISGFFNQIVFCTLLCTILFIGLVLLSLKIYYKKKY